MKDTGRQRVWGAAVLAACLALAAACDRPVRLAAAPTLYRTGADFPAEEVPPAARRLDAPVLFATDRAPEYRDGRLAGYGAGRSDSMAFGTAVVRFGDLPDWNALVARSEGGSRARLALVTMGYTEEVRLAPTPLPYVASPAGPVFDPAAEADYRAGIAAMQAAIAARLRDAPRKEVILFVHGFNNDLDDALSTTASLWHYAGRIGVPVSYSWPAGNRGVTAYFKDREAGEFTIFHLKEFLRALAAVPGLQSVKIVAHSRGTDVVTTALREIAIAEVAAGRDPRAALKLDTLILAAADLDYGVVRQRLAAEGTARIAGQVNIYLNPHDGALGLAQAVLTGTRMGRLDPDRLTEEEWAAMGELGHIHFIDVEDAPGRTGHAYFRDNPAVLSDVILTMRTGAEPGSAERPLERVRGNFWRLHPNYPGPRIVRVLPDSHDR